MWSDRIELRVDHPDETNIVIWNHHTEAMDGPPSCLGSHYFPPPGIIRLERIGRTRVFYLCSKVGQEGRSPLAYATARQDEVLSLVRRFRRLGVPAGRIFVAGQSGGACASLFALGAGADEMNAGLIFAPACSGPGEGRARAWGTADRELREVEAALTGFRRITALVVAFGQDRWNRPGDLGFFTEQYSTVRFVSPGCGAGHSGAFWGCGVDAVTAEVRLYFLDRLAAAGYSVGPTD